MKEVKEHMATTLYRFGEYELDPASYALRLGGTLVQVEPRVLELLVYLVQHRERVVSKDELLQQLWPQKYVTESVLTRAIYEARRALDDDSRRQHVIKTVHSRGYQFVAALRDCQDAGDEPATPDAEPPEQLEPPQETRVPVAVAPRRRLPFIASIAVFAMIAAVGVWFWISSQPASRERVAIAPFSVAAEAQDLEWGELALPRLVADVLSERSDVVVFPANRVRQSLQQRGLANDATEQEKVLALRDIFGVDHVLFGSVGRENGRLLINYHLVDVAGNQLSGRTSADGPGALSTQLAESVARELDVTYAAGIPVRKIAASEFTNEAFARGLNALLGGELADALRYFETSLASTPDNGWARYESGNVLMMLGHLDDATAAYEQARSNADSNGDLNLAGVASSGLGMIAWRRGQLDEAEISFKAAQKHFEAVNRRANLASALGNLGILAENRGELDLARERYETALSLYRNEGEKAGETAVYSNLAVLERKLGRLDAAAQMQQRAVALQRQIGLREMLVFSLANLGEIERNRGRWPDAESLLDEAVTLARETGYKIGEAEALTARGALETDLGQRDAAETDLRSARAIYSSVDNPNGDIRSALRLSLLLADAEPEEARRLAANAAAVARRIGDETMTLEAELALLNLGVGEPSRLLPRLQTLGDNRLIAISWAARARRERDPAHLRTALGHAERAGDQRLQAELAVETVRMLLERGEKDGIAPLLGRAELWKSDYPPALVARACHLASAGRKAEGMRLLQQSRAQGTENLEPQMTWCPHWQ